jgi:hypothetical protein
VFVGVFDGVNVSVEVGVNDAVSVTYKIPASAWFVAVAPAGSALRAMTSAVFVTVGVDVFVAVNVAVAVGVDVSVGVFVGTTFEILYTALVLNELSHVGSANVQSLVAPSSPAAITSNDIHSVPSACVSRV